MPSLPRIRRPRGRTLPSQRVAGAARLAVLVTVPQCGWQVIRVVPGRADSHDEVARVDRPCIAIGELADLVAGDAPLQSRHSVARGRSTHGPNLIS